MPTINIGINGSINYSINNNICYDSSSGSIVIDSIIFGDLFALFNDYTITWTSSSTTITSDQIRDNGKSLINLVAGTYYFTVESLTTTSSLGPYSVTVTSPSIFNLTDIKSSIYSCIDNGTITVSVTGGVSPYTFNIGNDSIEYTGTQFLATGLVPGTYTITAYDYNNCLANILVDDNEIIVKDATITINNIEILPPEIIDGYGQLNLAVSGYGPLSFNFIGQNETIKVDSLDNTHFSSYDPFTSTYYYRFKNILSPGPYVVNITNDFNCLDTQDLTIPNINPITASINVIPNSLSAPAPPAQIFSIFDTIFIPFENIKNNTPLWEFIQKCIHDNKIDIKINNQIVSYKIIKTFLFPYCIDNNIEILRLDNNNHNWYFVFHIAPGINLIDNLNLIGTEFFLVDNESHQEYKCLFGLDDNYNISYEYPSLLMGSLTIFGVANEYIKDTDVYIQISDTPPITSLDYDFIVKNIVPTIYFNVKAGQYTTSIYFLDNFETLIENINIDQTACDISHDDYEYILNIKNLLLNLNDFNNYQNLYISSNANSNNIGSITTYLIGNETVVQNETLVSNIYSIDYFTFDQKSTELLSFYKNDQKIKNTLLLNNIADGYIIMRIRDLNNNRIKFINTNNSIINYDTHFINAKNFLQDYNLNIIDKFEYGDILIYVPGSSTTNHNTGAISSPPSIPNTSGTPTVQPIETSYNRISQSNDTINTSSIIIQTIPNNSICYLLGPKNYKEKFIGNTKFENLIQGVYTIIGDEEYLSENKLYNNNVRVIVLKDQEYNLSIKFNSYLNKVFIKE